MKFALCGDSFCDAVYSPPRAPYDTWPYLVSEEFGGKIILVGNLNKFCSVKFVVRKKS